MPVVERKVHRLVHHKDRHRSGVEIIWKELGVLASETSIEFSNGVGVGDNANDAEGFDRERRN